MKRILFLFYFLLLFGFKTNAQSYSNEIPYINWIQQYESVNCYPSFYWSVTRTNIYNEYNQELYRIYFLSNSRYCNGSWAGTYVNGINIFVNGELMNKNGKYWVMFKDIYHNSAFSFWSYPNPKITLTWDNVTIN
jgi:hypothetical protein